MLATGSADTTVRVWDVGQQLLPHSEAWTRAKRRSRYNQQSESKGGGDGATEFCNISMLENVLVGHDNEDDTNDSTQAQKKDRQHAAAEKSGTVVSTENVRSAVRSLRPEIMRQAGARATWRTGRVTAVLEQEGRSLNHPTRAATVALAKKPGNNPLIEVQDVRYYANRFSSCVGAHWFRLYRIWIRLYRIFFVTNIFRYVGVTVSYTHLTLPTKA